MKLFKKIVTGISLAVAAIGTASATILTDAEAALGVAKSDASTVGGYVVAAVAVIAAIGIILSLVRKA